MLGVPWYGYDYPCIAFNSSNDECKIKSVPFRGVNCRCGHFLLFLSLTSHLSPLPPSLPLSLYLFLVQLTHYFVSLCHCFSDAAGSERDYSVVRTMLLNNATSGRKWNEKLKTPYFNYVDQSTKQIHQVRERKRERV